MHWRAVVFGRAISIQSSKLPHRIGAASLLHVAAISTFVRSEAYMPQGNTCMGQDQREEAIELRWIKAIADQLRDFSSTPPVHNRRSHAIGIREANIR